MPKTENKNLHRIITVIVALAAALIIVEILVRFLIPQPIGKTGAVTPIIGKKEFSPEPRRNRQGFNDKERAIEKPVGTVRIALIGDSMVEGVQVPWQENFVTLLEDKWNKGGEIAVEVFNFGIAGAGTGGELLALKNAVFPFSPDIICLCINPSNDIYNNSRELETKKTKPFFTLKNGRPQLLPPENIQKPPEHWFWKNVHFYRFVTRRWQMTMQKRKAQNLGGGVVLPLYVFSAKPNPVWERAWQITDALIGQFASEVHRRKILLAVAMIPVALEVDPNSWLQDEKLTQVYKNEKFDADLPHQRILDICKKHKLPVTDLYPDFRDVQNKGGGPLYFKTDGHLNKAGHKEAAKVLARDLIGLVEAIRSPASEN